MTEVKLQGTWRDILVDEFSKPYFIALKQKLIDEKKAGKVIYPLGSQIFAALDNTPFEKIKVVILGQDPYHGPGQAHGLCFSVNDGMAQPPSLQNIFKELREDIPGFKIPGSGN